MAAPFRNTNIKTFPRIGEKITRDTLYWKHLEFPITRKEFGGVSHIDFSSTEPHNFVVTSSTRVQIFSPDTNQIIKKFTRFKDTVYSANFRRDGQLMVTGSEDGHVRLFDIAGKALLRVFKGHSSATHFTTFTTDNVHAVSCSDDKSLRLWDIPGEAEVVRYDEHQDYVRCGAVSHASKDIIITGSYDHTVKLFDTRTPSSVLTVNHGQPVESVLVYPAGGIVLSAGGTSIKVWDVLSGGRLLTTFSNHHKTITCLGFCSNHQRILSAGLDRLVKIYDVSTYQVVHSLDFPSALLSVAVSPDDKVIVAGMSDGLLSIQHRKSEEEVEEHKVNAHRRKKKASYRYTLSKKSYQPTQEDEVVQHRRKEQLSQYDKFFKKFEHTKALDAALDLRVRVKTPSVTVSVMQELIRRGGIKAALAGRDEKALSIIIKFIQKNICDPKYMSVLIDISNMILDIYQDQIGHSALLDEMLLRLKEMLDTETGYMKSLLEVMGTMDILFAVSQNTDMAPQLSSTDSALKPSQRAQVDVCS